MDTSSSKGANIFPLSVSKNLEKWHKPELQIFIGLTLRKASFCVQSQHPTKVHCSLHLLVSTLSLYPLIHIDAGHPM